MYPQMNEDVMFERLKDMQREMENSRLIAGSVPSVGSLVRILGARIWWLAGLAMRRPPRARPASMREAYEESVRASDAA